MPTHHHYRHYPLASCLHFFARTPRIAGRARPALCGQLGLELVAVTATNPLQVLVLGAPVHDQADQASEDLSNVILEHVLNEKKIAHQLDEVGPLALLPLVLPTSRSTSFQILFFPLNVLVKSILHCKTDYVI